MKLKNIIVTGLMLSTMMSTAVVSSGFADTQKVTVSAGNETARAGESFSVDISLSDIQPTGINACEFAIQYDSSIISIDSVKKGNITNTGADSKDSTANDVVLFDSAVSDNIINVVWTTGADSSYWIKDSGVFCTISGKVLSSASNGDVASIKLVPISNDKMVFSYVDGDSKAYYDYTVLNGSVTVGEETTSENNNIVYGDANCDGKVTIADAVAIAAYVGNPDNNPLSSQGLINADVTGSGLDASDALCIQQYLSNIISKIPT